MLSILFVYAWNCDKNDNNVDNSRVSFIFVDLFMDLQVKMFFYVTPNPKILLPASWFTEQMFS